MELKFKPTKEVMETLRDWCIRQSCGFDDPKLELLLLCMDDFNKSKGYNEYTTPIFSIKCKLLSIIDKHRHNVMRTIYNEWKESKDGSFTIYCEDHDLWDKDQDQLRNFVYFNNEETPDEKISYYLENLVVLHTIVKTPDYFDDIEKFDQKRSDISQLIDDFVWDAEKMAKDYAIEEYKGFIVLEENCDNAI